MNLKTKTRNILFIINPKSGPGLFPKLDQRIDNYLKDSDIILTIKKTEYAGHATELCREAINSSERIDAIVVAGGDGTVNEVVNGIGLSGMPLGIIPTGSGNGLARHLGISMLPFWSIKNIIHGQVMAIDMMKIGKNTYAANVTGVGFDAIISSKFQFSKIRGPIAYAKLILEEFIKYKSSTYEIKIDGKKIVVDSAMITAANSSQFGNNVYIAPSASLTDGFINLCILKPFPKALALDIVTKLMTKQRENS